MAIKIENRKKHSKTHKFIGFNEFESRPFYCFEQDGEATAISGGDGEAWACHNVPTGKEVGKYTTLNEARAAHPDAYVKKGAWNAANSGHFE